MSVIPFCSLGVVLIAVVALFIGYRQGIIRQMGGVLGLTFGVVVAYVYGPAVEEWVLQRYHFGTDPLMSAFCCRIIGSGGVYLVVYSLFLLTSPIWRNVTRCFHPAIFSSVVGALFSLLKYMMVVSIVLNVYMCVYNDRELLKAGADDDGNLCALTLMLAPNLIGARDVVDLSNEIQRREARKISGIGDNNLPACYVSLL